MNCLTRKMIGIARFFAITILICAGFKEFSYAQEENSYKEKLSYGQKRMYFSKKGWARGLSEMTQTRQAHPWQQSSWREQVEYFVSSLRKGDPKVFLYVNYALLDGYKNPYTKNSVRGYPTYPGEVESKGVLWHLHELARKQDGTIRSVLTGDSDEIRKKVVKSVLSGLFNKDPRVRLIAINLLRRLGPDVMMLRATNRALVLETVATRMSKWRIKDIDVPTLESPRLGSGAMVWKGGALESLKDRFKGYRPDYDKSEFLDGNGKGLYLDEGLYKKGERSDYKVKIEERDYDDSGKSTFDEVWTKSSLLRYGADETESGFEKQYGFEPVETMPKYVYLHTDYRDPETDVRKETMYYAYHSVWEELNRLNLFIRRALWSHKIKSGDIDVLAQLSKDSFRVLVDQIDGESLEVVPMKSPSFKIFASNEIPAIIQGMLNNPVVSVREECARFLIRAYYSGKLSSSQREMIRESVKEARRRESILDTVRGRHLQAELLYFRHPEREVDLNDGTNGVAGDLLSDKKLKPKVVVQQEIPLSLVEENTSSVSNNEQ